MSQLVLKELVVRYVFEDGSEVTAEIDLEAHYTQHVTARGKNREDSELLAETVECSSRIAYTIFGPLE